MTKKSVLLLLLVATVISLFLHLYKHGQVPACLNADEAAFGYNAHALLKTGKDEYGKFLPLRLLSFRDYKLPLYTYLSIPSMVLFGTTDFSIRLLNIIIGVALVPLMYMVAKELFDDERVGLTAAFFTAFNTSHYILSRHAHEGVLCVFFILLGLLYFLKFLQKKSLFHILFANIFLLLASFSYHSGRLFFICLALYQGIILFKLKKSRYILIVFLAVLIPFITDFTYGANRVQNLAFYKDIGFQLRINEALDEHPNRILHNKLTEAVIESSNRYLIQLSPEFLVINGDKNPRFGMPGLGVVTPVEYVLFFVGLYFLFAKKQKFRYLLLLIFLTAPFANALTWTEASFVRTYFIVFVFMFIEAYGLINLYISIKSKSPRLLLVIVFLGTYVFFTAHTWDLYLNHYVKKPIVAEAWQCGYKELTDYIKINYDKYDKFVVTRKNGQPYIYFLYYLSYDPAKYQAQATISPPDEFGFGQVEKFNKFLFDFKYDSAAKKTLFVGYPEEFDGKSISNTNIVKKIAVNGKEIFWLVKSP